MLRAIEGGQCTVGASKRSTCLARRTCSLRQHRRLRQRQQAMSTLASFGRNRCSLHSCTVQRFCGGAAKQRKQSHVVGMRAASKERAAGEVPGTPATSEPGAEGNRWKQHSNESRKRNTHI